MTLAAALDALLAESWRTAGPTTASSWPPENRPDGAALAGFLRGRRYAVLATTRRDGRPHAAPISYVLADDASFWLPTAAGAVRIGHVDRTPWASLVVEEGEDDAHVAVIAEGPARHLDLAEAARAASAAGANLDDREREGWVAGWIVLTPERLLAYAAKPLATAESPV